MTPFAQMTSDELVRACAGSKDERLWAEFIHRFQMVIGAAVLRTTQQFCDPVREQLDDFIQDTYLKLCEGDCRLLRRFEPRQPNSIYGFLSIVASNIVRDHFKSILASKRGVHLTDSLAQPIPIDAAGKGVDSFDEVSHRIQMEKIDRALRSVTAGKDQERKRTIFWLCHRQGLTASEIAAIPSIGLTTEGVESLLLRLAIMIRSHILGTTPHRDVKVLSRKSRSRRLGT